MGLKNNNKIASILALVLASFTAVSSIAYAWLSGSWNSDNTRFGFTAGDVEYPTVTMWMYKTQEEGSTIGGEWVEKDVTVEGHKNVIPSSNPTSKAGFTMEDVHLGNVDNLVTLKKDNTVYLRLNMKRNMGTTFTLSVEHVKQDGYGFSIYQQGNSGYSLVDKSADVYDTLKTTFADPKNKKPILITTYAVSTNSLVPDGTGFSDLNFVNVCPSAPDQADDYYLYIKMMPDLSTVATIAKELYRYMPCIILFDLEIEYEIYTPVP